MNARRESSIFVGQCAVGQGLCGMARAWTRRVGVHVVTPRAELFVETFCNVRVAGSEIVFLREVAPEVVEFEAAVFEVFQQLPVACSNRAHGCGGGVGVRVMEGEGGMRENRSGDTSHQERREGYHDENSRE